MTALQKTLITTAIVTAVSTAIYEARQAAVWRERAMELHEQISEQVQQAQSERDKAMRQLAALRVENGRTNSNTELLKLRGEVGMLRRQNQLLAQAKVSLPKAQETQTLSKGFGTLGEYLALEDVSDAGNSTAEALLQTFVWALREGKMERLEQIGGPFGGQSVGELSETQAAMLKTVQNVFTNSAGLRLNSRLASDGKRHEVRLDAEPRRDDTANEFKNFKLSFILEQKAGHWGFGDPFEKANEQSK